MRFLLSFGRSLDFLLSRSLELLGLVTPLCAIWLLPRPLDFLLSRSLDLLGFIPGPPTALAAQVAGAGRRLTAVAPNGGGA